MKKVMMTASPICFSQYNISFFIRSLSIWLPPRKKPPPEVVQRSQARLHFMAAVFIFLLVE
jgi:hypothetical protein